MIPKALLIAIGLLPVFHEDKADDRKGAQLVTVAAAVHEAAREQKRWPGTRRELELLLFTIGWHESAFSLRIGEGRCKPHECDRGRAAGHWQMHRATSSSEAAWVASKTDIRIAAREAARALTRARWVCKGTSGDWLTETLRGYAGSGCRKSFRGEAARVATFRRLERGGQ